MRWLMLLGVLLLVHAPAWAQPEFWEQTTGPGGGFVHRLTITPEGVLFAVVGDEAGLDNHVYRSEDDGDTWTAVTLPEDEILTVEAGPSGVLLAARERGGFFRSRDTGATWQPLSFPGDLVRDIVFDDQGNVFVGAYDGVYRSGDEGDTWAQVGLAGLHVGALTTAGSAHILAATDEGVYRSTDGGTTWTPAAALKNPKALLGLPDGDVYVGVAGFVGFADNASGVFRLDTDGTLTLLGLDTLSVVSLAADADGRLFAGTIGICTGYICLAPAGLYRSTDEGVTWEAAGLMSTGVADLVFDAQGRLIAGTQGLFTDTGALPGRGMVRTDDEGATWMQVNKGIPHADAYGLWSGSDGVLYAVADHSVFRSADRGETWTPIYTSEPTLDAPWAPYYHLAVHPAGPLFLLAGHPPRYDGGIRFVSYMEGQLLRSTDQGQTWTTLDPGLTWFSVNALTVTSQGTLLVAARDTLMRSDDLGDTWTQVGEEMRYRVPWVLEPGAEGRLFAASVDPRALSTQIRFHVSVDEGMSWTTIADQNRGLLSEQTALAADTEGGLYAADASSQLMHFTLEGDVWTADEVHPDVDAPILNVEVDADGALYIATWDQLLRSTDDGMTWEDIGRGLQLDAFVREIHALEVGKDGFLYAGTTNGGVFRSMQPVVTAVASGPDVPALFDLGRNFPNPFLQETHIPFDLPRTARVTLAVYDVLGRQVAVLLDDASMPAGRHEVAWDASGRAGGVYFYKLIVEGTVKAGRMVFVK